jgi:hypothetical protein
LSRVSTDFSMPTLLKLFEIERRSRESIPIASTTAAVSTVAAATTAATVATATAATTGVSTSAATTAASTVSTTTTAAARALFAGFGFIDGQRAAAMFLAVERGDRRLRFIVAGHLDESEALAASGQPIADHLRTVDGSML